MAEVHKAAKEHSFLQGRECSIYFRIRYIIDCESTNLPSLPAECDKPGDHIQRMMASSAQKADEASEPECAMQEYSESASVDVSVGSSRHCYSASNNRIIAVVLKQYINSNAAVREDVVVSIFKETKQLDHLWRKLNPRQLVDKVRSMRKARKSKRK